MPPEEKKEESQAGDIVSSLMKRIAGGGEEAAKSSSFPVTLVLVGILVLVISIFGIRMAFAKRKAAELAAKIRKIEEEREQAKEKEKLAENSAARLAARDEVKALGKEILGLKAKMAHRQSAHEKEVEKLRSVTSWDDIVIVDARKNP